MHIFTRFNGSHKLFDLKKKSRDDTEYLKEILIA